MIAPPAQLTSSSHAPSHYVSIVVRVQIRRAHFEGFNAFLDCLVRDGNLTQDQVGRVCGLVCGVYYAMWCGCWLRFVCSLNMFEQMI